mgnify:CR=1 FL=1
MIHIKRIYDSASDDDGYRILIDRLWPRGFSKEKANIDLWMKDIAPSTDLRKWFHHDFEKWKEFQAKYQKELSGKIELLNELLRLENEKGTITLLYSTKDTQHNQARVLLAVLDNIAKTI